jgi:transcription termination factor Rho
MTETKEDEPLRAADEPASAEPPEPATSAKKAPRRKGATRGKLAADPAAAGVAGPVKASRARKPQAAATDPGETAGPAAAGEPSQQQPELLSPADMERSHAPEAHVATQVISADAYEALQQRTAKIFGQPGQPETVARPALDNTAAPAPVAAAGLIANPPDLPVKSDAGESSPEPPQPAAAGSSAAPPPAQEPTGFSRDAAPPPTAPPYQSNAPAGPRYSDQERSGDRRGQDRYPRPQQHGQQQRHGQQQQPHRSFQPRGENTQPPQYGGQQRDREPRGDGQFGGQPQQPSGQDGGDPLVSRVTETQYGEGIVEVSGKGFGFLREAKRNFVQTPADVFVTPEVCRKYNLRDGQWIKGEIRRSSRGPQLFRLTSLNGEDPEKYRDLPNFEELTTINPKKRIRLETVPERYTTRVMDLMTPIGKGQRGLIVAPPRTGKTTLLQHIAEAVVKNHPEMKLIILLVDERPEEVTEIRRTVPQAEMMASSNDSDLKSHTRIAQLAMERAKRLVEANFDVFILLDSITRVGRAFNNAMTGGGGRTMSGGIDARAMEIPRKIFAAARNTEEAGSLTIMATALIDTGSKMDEVIFQEFKGTGNMELVLDRKISDQRIYPAVDIFLSGTRREELLLQPWELDKINVIRRGLAGHKPIEAIERLLSFLKKFPTNAQMLTSLPG